MDVQRTQKLICVLFSFLTIFTIIKLDVGANLVRNVIDVGGDFFIKTLEQRHDKLSEFIIKNNESVINPAICSEIDKNRVRKISYCSKYISGVGVQQVTDNGICFSNGRYYPKNNEIMGMENRQVINMISPFNNSDEQFLTLIIGELRYYISGAFDMDEYIFPFCSDCVFISNVQLERGYYSLAKQLYGTPVFISFDYHYINSVSNLISFFLSLVVVGLLFVLFLRDNISGLVLWFYYLVGRYILHYQPILDNNCQIVGYESLLRINGFIFGDIYPKDFIIRFEVMHSLNKLVTLSMIEKIINISNDNSEYYFSINVTTRQIEDVYFVNKVVELSSKISGGKIDFELTERSSFFNKTLAISNMNKIIEAGIAFKMDDVGVGHGGFEYLLDFPFSSIKIDRLFIENIKYCDKSRDLVLSLVMLAKKLGLDIVAEGVENYQQYEILNSLGIQYFQGFFFSVPMKTVNPYNDMKIIKSNGFYLGRNRAT